MGRPLDLHLRPMLWWHCIQSCFTLVVAWRKVWLLFIIAFIECIFNNRYVLPAAGSDHTINGVAYDMELQLFFYNSVKSSSFDAATAVSEQMPKFLYVVNSYCFRMEMRLEWVSLLAKALLTTITLHRSSQLYQLAGLHRGSTWLLLASTLDLCWSRRLQEDFFSTSLIDIPNFLLIKHGNNCSCMMPSGAPCRILHAQKAWAGLYLKRRLPFPKCKLVSVVLCWFAIVHWLHLDWCLFWDSASYWWQQHSTWVCWTKCSRNTGHWESLNKALCCWFEDVL